MTAGPGEESGAELLDQIVPVYAEILGCEVDPHLDIYAMGGDSVAAVQIAIELERTFGLELPLEEFEENSSPALVAAYVAAQLGRRDG